MAVVEMRKNPREIAIVSLIMTANNLWRDWLFESMMYVIIRESMVSEVFAEPTSFPVKILDTL
jgi:hypothetical protein